MGIVIKRYETKYLEEVLVVFSSPNPRQPLQGFIRDAEQVDSFTWLWEKPHYIASRLGLVCLTVLPHARNMVPTRLAICAKRIWRLNKKAIWLHDEQCGVIASGLFDLRRILHIRLFLDS
jgi:hypothetical protein